MTRSPSLAAVSLVALLTAAALAGCGGSDVLAPPDGANCTVGSIAPGDSVKGEVSAASCAGFSDMNYETILFQSWTLHARKNKAYVVRLRHVENADSADNWKGDLYAYTRNDAGDAEWATGWWESFGLANANGGGNEELLLATDRDRTYSLRVQVNSAANAGANTLSVEECALHPLPGPAQSVAGVDLASACVSLGVGAEPYRLAFFSFPADTFHTYHALATRTAGEGTLWAHVSGPDDDVGCYTDNCTWSTYLSGVTDVDLNLSDAITRAGRQTFALAVRADSSATVSASYTETAKAASVGRQER